jgi:hypothetical protein
MFRGHCQPLRERFIRPHPPKADGSILERQLPFASPEWQSEMLGLKKAAKAGTLWFPYPDGSVRPGCRLLDSWGISPFGGPARGKNGLFCPIGIQITKAGVGDPTQNTNTS